MIWNIVYNNLMEARGDICELRDTAVDIVAGRRELDDEFYELPFYVAMHHVYHHLNWAWNCRNKDEQRAIRCDMKDFHAWEKFPRYFKSLWLPKSTCQGKPREVKYGKLALGASAVALDEAVHITNALCCSLLKTLGREIYDDWLDGRKAESVEPISPETFEAGMLQLYRAVNRAWNERKLDQTALGALSINARRRHECFPRAFADLWKEEGKTDETQF